MNAVETIDELVREYLVFRGCLGALRAWEADLKADRDKGFQVERIVDQLFAAISAYDLAALTDLWNYLDTRFFARLEEQHLRTVKRLELCLFRYYLVHAAQHNRRDKILEFFETLGQEAVDSDDWTPWFSLPFVRKPETDPYFEPFFGRHWLETFVLSLHNFLQTVFHSLPLPALLAFNTDRLRIRALELEIESLRRTVAALSTQRTASHDDDVEALPPSGVASATPRVTPRPSAAGAATPARLPSIPEVPEVVSDGDGGSDPVAGTAAPPHGASAFTVVAEHTFSDHDAPVVLARFAPSGALAASADADRVLRIWTPPAVYAAESALAPPAATPTLVTSHKQVLPAEIASLQWDLKSERLLFVGTDAASIRVYNAESRSFVHEFGSDSAYPWMGEVQCSPAEPVIVAAGWTGAPKGEAAADREGVLAGWNLRSMGTKPLFTMTLTVPGADQLALVRCLTFNHNGQLLATGDARGVVRILDMRSLTVVLSWQSHDAGLLGTRFSFNETELRCIGLDGRLAEWSLRSYKTPRLEAQLPEFQLPAAVSTARAGRLPGQIAFDENGDYFLATSARRRVPIYTAASGKWVGALDGAEAGTACVDWARAGNACLLGSPDRAVRLYKLSDIGEL